MSGAFRLVVENRLVPPTQRRIGTSRGATSSSTMARPMAESKVEEIARVLGDAIVEGDIPAGTFLRQDQLSKQLGVSRTPVREALRHLAAQGLVSLEPNRGMRVSVPSHEQLTEAYLIRAELEGLAAELALAQITKAELRSLRKAEKAVVAVTQRLRTAKRGSELQWLSEEWIRTNLQFHDVINDAARAPRLRQLVRSVRTFTAMRKLVWHSRPELEPFYEQSLHQHRAIVVAFEERDPAVRDLAKQHILDSLTFIEAILANIADTRPLLLGASVRLGDGANGHAAASGGSPTLRL